MADLWHDWGTDLSFGPTGDLKVADSTVFGQQRVTRRLLTNPGDYIWNLNYGAGLAGFVGKTIQPMLMRSVILAQMRLEASVSRVPMPAVVIDSSLTASDGRVAVGINYRDATSLSATNIMLNVGS
jgi:hypothetical protein